MIFLIAMVMVYIGGGVFFWSVAGSMDYEGDYLWYSLYWTLLAWVLPALAVLRLTT